ncbi:hypothetical protein POM88_054452 [Heracleum sosnowskyi]|uniref:Uncharacterized protein n=1 Tax=Heracleum sosnowskyi TaxID=360622 RepID=A0AAD8GMA5_9APIA|nr:hypothetical protein POM88_054452 [Heracleum sosnowskyi]
MDLSIRQFVQGEMYPEGYFVLHKDDHSSDGSFYRHHRNCLVDDNAPLCSSPPFPLLLRPSSSLPFPTTIDVQLQSPPPPIRLPPTSGHDSPPISNVVTSSMTIIISSPPRRCTDLHHYRSALLTRRTHL